MKMVSYFLISAAFHAAVFTFPISGFDTERERAVPVVLLVETRKTPPQTPPGTTNAQQVETKARKKISKKSQIKKPAEQVVEPSKPAPQKKQDEEKEADSENEMSPPLIEKVREEEPVVADGVRPDIKRVKVSSTTMMVEESAEVKEEPKELVSLQTEVNLQPAAEEKKNDMPSAKAAFTQAGYAYNPRPHYPEEARREGWEGEVLLRVLVGPEGRPESVELSRSSGFESLDQAALHSVKSWRFHPARYGDQRVESWVKIPIVFRLADLKN